MSGGSLDYAYRNIESLADDIEVILLNDFKYNLDDYDVVWHGYGDRPKKDRDNLQEATPEQKELIVKEVTDLFLTLRDCTKRAKSLEWLLSGDYGIDSYLNSLK